MKILYITNTRIPTEKAHGMAVMKMCEAFTLQGANISLIAPKRRNPIRSSAFVFYGIQHKFPIRLFPTIDTIGLGRPGFFFQACTFYLGVYIWALFQSRNVLIYTTDAPLVPLSYLGFCVVFECHAVPKKQGFFFRLRRR
jgi:hypothetical protein